MTSYCMRCKRKTANKGESVRVASNGVRMLHSHCGVCNTKKCQAVSKSRHTGRRGKGFLGDIIKGGAGWLVNRGVSALGI